MSVQDYNYRSDIWVGENEPQIASKNASNPLYTVFWYKVTKDNPDDRKLLINIFIPNKETGEWKRKWVDAAILSIATIERLGGFYNIKGDEWLNYMKYVMDDIDNPRNPEYNDINSKDYFQRQGNVGVLEDSGKLRVVSVDNGTFTLE